MTFHEFTFHFIKPTLASTFAGMRESIAFLTKTLIQACLIIGIFACSKRTDYLIQIPTETSITSEEILTELENSAGYDPENERLIRQQLYFCEQLGWPARCEQVLIRAKSKWGLTEKLLDQSIAYYEKYKDYERVAALLNGAFETRSRLETKIKLASSQTPGDYTYLERYTSQYQDEAALSLAAKTYLHQEDTSRATVKFEQLLESNPSHKDLVSYYPLLEKEGKFIKSAQLIEKQLSIRGNQPGLQYDLALNYYRMDSLNKAKTLLRQLGSEKANGTLVEWFRERQEWDSALMYVDVLLQSSPDNRHHLLTKAEVLESKGWLTPSLPYYEQAFAKDTTDTELAEYLQIVRRKVAYLRLKKEQEERLLPPSLERKTGN